MVTFAVKLSIGPVKGYNYISTLLRETVHCKDKVAQIQ